MWRERQRLRDEVGSLKKKISRICWLVELTTIYTYTYIYIYIYIYICIYSIQQNLAYKPFMYTSLWQVLTMLNNRRTYIEGLQASKKSVQKEQLWRLALTLSKYIFIYWRVWTLMHQNKSRVILINLYTLTLSCIFSILIVIHFLRCWQGEFVCQSKGSFPGVWPFPLFSWP